ncbi:MAG: MFS transporter [Chloroflexi bacterium]|nr:MFS transporter [Chloroflexota bacterium]
MTNNSFRAGKIYYGWVVVAIAFILFSVGFGIQNSFGIFFKPLQETFGWSRATTSWAMTIHLIIFASCLAPVGLVIDRVNTRGLYTTSALLVGLSLVLSSRISEPWQLYLFYGFLGMGVSISGPVLYTVVTRWFTAKRGLALGIASGGVGFGTLVGAPVANWLIGDYGWRNAFIILGVVGCAIILVCANFLKITKTANQTGLERGQPARQPLPPSGMTLKQAIGTREFLFIVVTFVMATFALRIVAVHIAPHAIDVGITPSMAALAIGTIGIFSLLGRLVMGFAQDKIGPKLSLSICLTIQGMVMLALPLVRSDLMFFLFAVVFGFSYGGDAPQLPALSARCFGISSMAIIYGLMSTIGNFTGGFGPIIAGYLFDFTGSYTIVFLSTAVSLFIAVLCVWKLRLRY